jgi:hypothetical protein
LSPEIPVKLIPKILGVFDVWQNALSELENGRSKAMLQLANAWLMRFEKHELRDKSDGDEEKAWTFSRDESSLLEKSLRSFLLRSARSYPDFAKELFKRAIGDEDRRRAVYADLIAFSPIMTQVDPNLVADLAEAELVKELPEDKLIRERKEREERYKRLEELRAIPEERRTRKQNLVLQSASTRLIIALHHDRRFVAPRADNAERLLKLALHPLDNVSEFAFDALFADRDEHLRWIAGQLAVNL